LAVGNPVQPDLVTFGGLINRFLREALPERKGTADRYRSWILNHINPRWEALPLSKVKPLAVEMWIKGLNLAPKSKGHVRSVMHILFEWAMRWELIGYNRRSFKVSGRTSMKILDNVHGGRVARASSK
jgi:integrase